jgi:hypothetical protein
MRSSFATICAKERFGARVHAAERKNRPAMKGARGRG